MCGCVCICVCLCHRPWKFEHMAADLLSLLLREDHPLPPDAVLYFTQSLIHDSISIRKVCSCVCTVCLSEFIFLWTKCKCFLVAFNIPLGLEDGDGFDKKKTFFLVHYMQFTSNLINARAVMACWQHRIWPPWKIVEDPCAWGLMLESNRAEILKFGSNSDVMWSFRHGCTWLQHRFCVLISYYILIFMNFAILNQQETVSSVSATLDVIQTVTSHHHFQLSLIRHLQKAKRLSKAFMFFFHFPRPF